MKMCEVNVRVRYAYMLTPKGMLYHIAWAFCAYYP